VTDDLRDSDAFVRRLTDSVHVAAACDPNCWRPTARVTTIRAANSSRLDAETGVFMLLFLDLSFDEAKRSGRLSNVRDLDEAIVHGAVKRARPKLMTVAAAFMGLLPIMWSTSAGADVMKRIAAPMIGGLATSFILELVVYPAVYKLWKWRTVVNRISPDTPTATGHP